MNKEEMKEKAKNFWEKNKLAVGAVLIGGICCYVGYKAALHELDVKKDDVVIRSNSGKMFFEDVYRCYPNGHSTSVEVFDIPLTTDKLGELGKYINEHVPEGVDAKFTHFLALGPRSE